MCFRTTGQFQLLYTCIIELQYVIVRGKLKKCFENWSLQATLFQHGEWPARCLLMKNRPEWKVFSNSQEIDFVILNKQGSLSCHICYDTEPPSEGLPYLVTTGTLWWHILIQIPTRIFAKEKNNKYTN